MEHWNLMPIFRYERHGQPLASHAEFLGRLAFNFVVALGLVAFSLGLD
jgi:hypothetical protein